MDFYRIITITLLSVFSSSFLLANDDVNPDTLAVDTSSTATLLQTSKKDVIPKINPLKEITFSGYARFAGYGRRLYDVYQNALAAQFPVTSKVPKKVIGFNDGFSRSEPVVRLDMTARPSKNTKLTADVTFYTDFDGSLHTNDTLDSKLSLNLGVNLRGDFKTHFGDFSIQAGGINWYRMSPLTMWDFEGYDRKSIFERNPWDPMEKGVQRAKALYERGAINRDTRFGKQPFKGFLVEGNNMPKGYSAVAMVGKVQVHGIDDFSHPLFSTIPNYMVAGQVKKTFAEGHELSLNTMNNYKYFNNYTDDSQFLIEPYIDTVVISNSVTLGYKRNIAGIDIDSEFGLGRFLDSGRRPEFDWFSEGDAGDFFKRNFAGTLKLSFPKKMTFLPLQVEFFSIGQSYVNTNGSFIASSTQQAYNNVDSKGVFDPTFSSLTEVGKMNSNRFGFTVNTEVKIKKFKLGAGLSTSSEFDFLTNKIAFDKKINGVTLGRLAPFSSFGPYNRITSVFRDAYEVIEITDNELNDTHFSTLQVHGKYNVKIFDRDLYAFYVGSVATARDEYYILPDFDFTGIFRDAYLRRMSHELDLFYHITKPVVAVLSGGFERAMGNYETRLDVDTRLPTDQYTYYVGLGTNVDLSDNVSLYVRHRFFDHEDKNFAYDKYNGHETSAELKLFF